MPPDRTAALANTSAGACQPRGRQLRVAHRVGDRDLTSGSGPKTFHVRWLQGSNDSVHTLDRDEVSALRTLKASSMSPYAFTSERGGRSTHGQEDPEACPFPHLLGHAQSRVAACEAVQHLLAAAGSSPAATAAAGARFIARHPEDTRWAALLTATGPLPSAQSETALFTSLAQNGREKDGVRPPSRFRWRLSRIGCVVRERLSHSLMVPCKALPRMRRPTLSAPSRQCCYAASPQARDATCNSAIR